MDMVPAPKEHRNSEELAKEQEQENCSPLSKDKNARPNVKLLDDKSEDSGSWEMLSHSSDAKHPNSPKEPLSNLKPPHSSVTLIKIPQVNEPYLEIDVPNDGTCYFYAVALGVLLPLVNIPDQFNTNFVKLFGKDLDLEASEQLRNTLKTYNGDPKFIKQHVPDLEILIETEFRKKIVAFIRENKNEFNNVKFTENEDFDAALKRMEAAKTWASLREIEATSRFLKRGIIVFIKDETGNFKEQATCGENFGGVPIYLRHVNNHFHFLIPAHHFPLQAPKEDLKKAGASNNGIDLKYGNSESQSGVPASENQESSKEKPIKIVVGGCVIYLGKAEAIVDDEFQLFGGRKALLERMQEGIKSKRVEFDGIKSDLVSDLTSVPELSKEDKLKMIIAYEIRVRFLDDSLPESLRNTKEYRELKTIYQKVNANFIEKVNYINKTIFKDEKVRSAGKLFAYLFYPEKHQDKKREANLAIDYKQLYQDLLDAKREQVRVERDLDSYCLLPETYQTYVNLVFGIGKLQRNYDTRSNCPLPSSFDAAAEASDMEIVILEQSGEEYKPMRVIKPTVNKGRSA